jgi:hypothetical protein
MTTMFSTGFTDFWLNRIGAERVAGGKWRIGAAKRVGNAHERYENRLEAAA